MKELVLNELACVYGGKGSPKPPEPKEKPPAPKDNPAPTPSGAIVEGEGQITICPEWLKGCITIKIHPKEERK